MVDERDNLIEAVQTAKIDAIDKLIQDIYEQRKEGLATEEAEYSLGNSLFREFRSRGYLDNLKDLKNELIGKELSLKEQEITEGTEKVKDHKWVNRGKEGTHGEFRTKKEADAQRKSMFANEFSEDLGEAFVGTIKQVIELPDFKDAREEFGLVDEDIEQAKNEIIQNPNVGDRIKGCHGARKLRIAITASNKGKSGGTRAAYLNYYSDETAYLISIIVKADQEEFTEKQKKQIAKVVDIIKANH